MTAGSHARRIVSQLPPQVRHDLAEAPRRAIEQHFGLTVMPATSFEERGAYGWCDGMSETRAGIVLYRRTQSRRENFTLAHELAHKLVDEDEDCPSWLGDRPDPLREQEEVCDLIASEILIPADALKWSLDDGPPAAATVAALFETTVASRAACAIAVANRLPCDGFVALVAPGESVIFSASRARDSRPYAWKGDPIPAAHPLARADPPAAAKTWWEDRRGQRREYYMTTTDVGGFTCAVFAENDLWGVERLHTYSPSEQDRGNDAVITCPCGYTGKTRWWPCDRCGVPQCSKCQECDCARRERREARDRCQGCFMSVRTHLLVDGFCDNCR